MASRIISVTFETETQGRAGAFTIPKPAANLLGIGADDAAELRITWEGGKLELRTELRSGWEVYPRSSDESTKGLETIPARTPITVTVWRLGEADSVEPESDDETAWTDDRFDRAFAGSGGPPDLLIRLRDWAVDHDVALRYGLGKSSGPLHFDASSNPRIVLFNVGATGTIEWIFRDNLDRSRGFAARSTRVEFVRRLSELFEVDRPDERADVWFGVPAAGLAESNHADFLRLLDEELELVRQGPTGLRLQYQRLFTRILERFKELRPDATTTQRVGTDNWLEFSAGRSGIRFSWSTALRKYLRAELYIDVGRQVENKRLFDRLKDRAAEFEAAVGQPISWERLDHRRASRLSVYARTPTDAFDTDEELIEWAAQTMAKLVDVFKPVVPTL